MRCLIEAIAKDLEACRCRTLDLLNRVEPILLTQQAHPDFSPIGWHLGHIAFTESYWILEHCAGFPPLFPQYHQLFAADGLPKTERQNLPSPEVIKDYLEIVRTKVLIYLQTAPIDRQQRLWHWLIQHESQHNEIICLILQLHYLRSSGVAGVTEVTGGIDIKQLSRLPRQRQSVKALIVDEMIEIPSGRFLMGNERIEAQDNERPDHWVELDSYWLDPYPVTCAQYREFMEMGGYQKQKFWSQQGWQWLQNTSVSQPLYWMDNSDWDDHPVWGVSWYEAEAYANFVGKRLPTEAEWEKAASWDLQKGQKNSYPWGEGEPNALRCNYDTLVGGTTPVNAYLEGKSPYGCYDLLGNVWEWTDSWFDSYPGFQPYPYRGYSQSYFDRQHRVLRGGSWATRLWGLRNSFRNWYHPEVRQIFAGFRCAR